MFFVKAHQKAGHGPGENYSHLRLNYYPPIPPSYEIASDQKRCGEHVDFGSVSFLFQDPIGGLQV